MKSVARLVRGEKTTNKFSALKTSSSQMKRGQKWNGPGFFEARALMIEPSLCRSTSFQRAYISEQ